jgi:predicted alpha/beta-hydrolase family hydrolase
VPQGALSSSRLRWHHRGVQVDTPHGPARVHLRLVDEPRAALVLGHGAGGGVGAPDLVAATDAARGAGVAVALVEQPYRVAGRRSPAPAGQLDAAWTAVVEHLLAGELLRLPLLVGGRSSGARVACRTAADTGAVGVVCLAFPVHPPGRPDKSRLGELDAVVVPTLVVQGEHDPFGMPPGGRRRTVVVVPGGHALRSAAAVRDAVAAWLARQLPASRSATRSKKVAQPRSAAS